MKYDWSTAEAWGKAGAGLLLGTVLYIAFCSFCATSVPVAQDVALVLGLLGGFPVWVGGIYYAVLSQTVVRAWLVLGAAIGLLAGAVLYAQFIA
ncbi:hypothetical protein [Salinibacter altiplanensis]|uniref:hypothetical protein n=1 Tax=Salinibacter altiplanensis TaxID=1803181 RepID=UPI000C9FFBF0|nr:hypothetical protein [Salinibacter altiplanensis]